MYSYAVIKNESLCLNTIEGFTLKKGFLVYVFLFMATGCGVYSDYNLNSSILEYKQTCFGSSNVSCQSMLVDVNILMLERFRDHLDEGENQIKESLSAEVYELYLATGSMIVEQEIERQEDQRPSWYWRWFFGDANISPSRNYLITSVELNDMVQRIVKKVSLSHKPVSNTLDSNVETSNGSQKTLCDSVLSLVNVSPKETIHNIGNPSSVSNKNVANEYDQSVQDKKIFLEYGSSYLEYYYITNADKYLLTSVKFYTSNFTDVFKEVIPNTKARTIKKYGDPDERSKNNLQYYCSDEGNDWIDIIYDADQRRTGFEYTGYSG